VEGEEGGDVCSCCMNWSPVPPGVDDDASEQSFIVRVRNLRKR
jgi:hypothetical protein